MLAPTRELVAELNRRARDAPQRHYPRIAEVQLADGNQASVGDVIVTRRNDRRLRVSATDWVKNGDRGPSPLGQRRRPDRPAHRSRLTVRLPADYVRSSTDSATPPPSTPPKASPPTPPTASPA